jgi:DNA-binding transcriptional MocR family regulator
VTAEAQIKIGTRVSAMADELRRQITSGAWSTGHHLPSVRDLARSHGVSAFTAARVYDLLVAEGIVDARRGAGYFVAQNSDRLKTGARIGVEPASDALWALRCSYGSASVRLEAGCGWLPANWLFAEGVQRALTSVARRPAAYMGRYGSPYGLRTLRKHLSIRLLHRGIECSDDEIVLTHGASQGLELSISLLTQPGDTVLVDDPSYPFALSMLRARGVRAVGVPRTASGPDVEALQSLASTHRPRAFVTNTTFHNPTGTTTSVQVAHDVLVLAKRYNFTIVEDDIFAELAPERTPNLASLSRLRNIIYVGSFSKTISPNLRVGFVVASADTAEKIASLKNTLSLSSSELMEQIVLAALTGGRHRTHLERLRHRLADAREHATRRFLAAGAEIPFRGGGMFLWVKLPTTLDSSAIMRLAKSEGILLAPGELFRLDGRSTGHYRFNVAYSDSDLLFSFVDSLASM